MSPVWSEPRSVSPCSAVCSPGSAAVQARCGSRWCWAARCNCLVRRWPGSKAGATAEPALTAGKQTTTSLATPALPYLSLPDRPLYPGFTTSGGHMPHRVRRVITGHNKEGRSVFLMDGLAPNIKEMESMPGVALTDLWETTTSPASNAGDADAA